MDRIIPLLFLLSLVTACNKAPVDCATGAQAEETGTTTTACPVDTELPVEVEPGSEEPDAPLPNAALTFDTNITFINTSSTQQEKFDRAIEMIKKVVATEEFRNKILNHTYNNQKTFVDNGGYSNAQIYQKILDASEKLIPGKNNTMDMGVELYYASTSTVGYTYANITKIYVNTKYFDTNTVGGVAANLFHEWLHKIGFEHASSYSTARDYSVPYAVGRMISTLGSTIQ
jgi:hypothetical protein